MSLEAILARINSLRSEEQEEVHRQHVYLLKGACSTAERVDTCRPVGTCATWPAGQCACNSCMCEQSAGLVWRWSPQTFKLIYTSFIATKLIDSHPFMAAVRPPTSMGQPDKHSCCFWRRKDGHTNSARNSSSIWALRRPFDVMPLLERGYLERLAHSSADHAVNMGQLGYRCIAIANIF